MLLENTRWWDLYRFRWRRLSSKQLRWRRLSSKQQVHQGLSDYLQLAVQLRTSGASLDTHQLSSKCHRPCSPEHGQELEPQQSANQQTLVAEPIQISVRIISDPAPVTNDGYLYVDPPIRGAWPDSVGQARGRYIYDKIRAKIVHVAQSVGLNVDCRDIRLIGYETRRSRVQPGKGDDCQSAVRVKERVHCRAIDYWTLHERAGCPELRVFLGPDERLITAPYPTGGIPAQEGRTIGLYDLTSIVTLDRHRPREFPPAQAFGKLASSMADLANGLDDRVRWITNEEEVSSADLLLAGCLGRHGSAPAKLQARLAQDRQARSGRVAARLRAPPYPNPLGAHPRCPRPWHPSPCP